MKILITGGAGYIGSQVAHYLLNEGHEIVIIDDLSFSSINNVAKKAIFYEGNLIDKDFVSQIFEKENDIEIIMHFASGKNSKKNFLYPIEYFENDVLSTINLLKESSKLNLRTILFTSSFEVYGYTPNLPTDEFDIKNPIDFLGETKSTIETLIRNWAEVNFCNFLIFRCFDVYGTIKKNGLQRKNLNGIISNLVEASINESKDFYIFDNSASTKDGSIERDFLHIQDLIDAFLAGIEWSNKSNRSGLFNIGSGKSYTMFELHKIASKLFKKEISYQIITNEFRGPEKSCASILLASEVLKWKPKFDIRKIIRSERQLVKSFLNDKSMCH